MGKFKNGQIFLKKQTGQILDKIKSFEGEKGKNNTGENNPPVYRLG